MLTLNEDVLQDLARSTSAVGKIIEAHAGWDDTVCKVVIELNESLQNMQLREAITQLWTADGFIASVSRDGFLMIDGVRGVEQEGELDLIASVSHQIKEYAKASMQRDARQEMTASPELAFLAQTAKEQDSAAIR